MKLNEALKSALLTYEAFDIIESIIDYGLTHDVYKSFYS